MEQGAARRVPRALERGGHGHREAGRGENTVYLRQLAVESGVLWSSNRDWNHPFFQDQQQQPGGPGTGPVQLDYTLELKTITEKRVSKRFLSSNLC